MSSTMLMQFVVCACVLYVGISAATIDDFPKPLQRCSSKDTRCMINQANSFFLTYAKGLPEMGISQLEPFQLDKIEILGDRNSPARFDLFLSDVKIYNYSTLEVTNVKFSNLVVGSDKPLKVVIKAKTDGMTFKAKYKADGQILVLPISGEGDLVWRLMGVDGVTTVLLKQEKREDGKHYLKVLDYKIEMKLKNLHTDMTNLFNGDKLLSDNILKVINDNWELIGEDIMKTVNAAIAKSHAHDLNIFLKNIPFENFFLPDNQVE